MAGSYQDAVAKFRRDLIERSLLEADGNQNRAAALLNISRQALAYLLPFLWCFNEALIGEGSPAAIAYVIVTALAASFLLARGMQIFRIRKPRDVAVAVLLFVAAVVVGSSTVWLGPESAASLAVEEPGSICDESSSNARARACRSENRSASRDMAGTSSA